MNGWRWRATSGARRIGASARLCLRTARNGRPLRWRARRERIRRLSLIARNPSVRSFAIARPPQGEQDRGGPLTDLSQTTKTADEPMEWTIQILAHTPWWVYGCSPISSGAEFARSARPMSRPTIGADSGAADRLGLYDLTRHTGSTPRRSRHGSWRWRSASRSARRSCAARR